ncbi:hypothetical protein DP107_03190 [Haloglomus irregulare]|uniref:PrgI family protein n=1 Tax=Haloglomus irregulare TaxID=2234134 RepID=A0A554NFL4_9EURY|nr:hypothetical protein [Haloglomus irregulare]TSD16179.1 hypothetical protein DP107_03190 [Haloglomus irregulare]
MSVHDPTKRIPNGLKAETKLFGRYSLTDLAVGLFPGVLVILATQLLVPDAVIGGIAIQTLALPLAGAAVLVGALFVYLTPSYTGSLDWFGTLVGYRMRAHDHDHEAAKGFTLIERVDVETDTIERTDGALIGMVQVDPASMALATAEEWQAQAGVFEDFLNTVVEFPIQLYATTQAFPVEEYLGHYEERLGDADVKANPQLTALVESYIDWYGDELEARRMTIRDHYVVVPVTPEEVSFERESMVERLSVIPVLGVFIRAVLAGGEAEQHAAMVETLDDRLARTERGLREIDGCGARRVPAADAALLVAKFWTGEEREYGDAPESVFGRTPIVGGVGP